MPGEVTFRSEGATLHGCLFVPEGDPPYALVVMIHGFSATAKGMTADYYPSKEFDVASAAQTRFLVRTLLRSSA